MTDRTPNRTDTIADLSAVERMDIASAARAAVRVVAEPPAGGGAVELTALAAAVEDCALAAYVGGRTSGLCHEGALELFRDAAEGAALALCEARLRQTT